LVLAALLPAQDIPAWDLYQLGREAEKAGRMAQAYLLYSQAAAKEPSNKTYWQRSHAVQTRAALEAKVMPALEKRDADSDSADDGDAQPPEDATYDDIRQAGQALPPSDLSATVEAPLGDYDLRGDSRNLFETLARQLGLECVFDGDYTPTAPIHFLLKQVDYKTAIRGMEAATGSFIIPLSSKIFMVAKDTPQKRAELAPRAAVSIPLPETITQQDFNGVVTAVQQALSIEKISFDTQTHTVIIRDIVPKVVAARALFNNLMRARPQVMVDVKFLEVTRNDMLTYGVNFPNLVSFSPLTTWLNNPVSIPSTINSLFTFGAGKTLIGMGIMTPSMVAQMSKTKGAAMLDAQIQAADGQPATMHVGERYPVLTSGYFGPSDFTSGATAYTPPPSFTFEDLGLTLKLTPTLHNLETVTLDIDAQFRVLTSQSVNGIPVIGSEELKSAVGLKLGEWAALGGLMTVNQAKTITGVAGLSRVPLIKELTTTHTNTSNTDEILVLVRPRLVSLPAGAIGSTLTFSIGSETRPVTLL
jgi:general secretion pathway protein D